ncbi:T9SS type A sorting domain-containing protein [bacterium]|nr:T9SS type A sorting domain-containing protein [bacterium]
MKKVILLALCFALVSSLAFSAKFSPTLLKLSAAPTVQYDFTGKPLEIPVTVSGTNALVWFFVYTKDQAAKIAPVQNGFMGWHYVSKIDTCVFMSAPFNFSKGSNTVTWNGKDQDGGIVPAGTYTYYMWAYDAMGAKTPVCKFMYLYYQTAQYQELDTSGKPLANPIFYNKTQRWIIGNDPADSTLIETCAVTLPTGWAKGDNLWMDQKDFNYVFQGVKNSEAQTMGITRWKWTPNGDAVQVTDFGEDGYALFNSQCDSHSPIINSDSNYLYTADQGYHNPDGVSNFYIFDFAGTKIAELDMMEWWADPADLEGNGQMIGGPDTQDIRNGMVFLNCHCSCLNQMVDPMAWLDSGDTVDFYKWSNSNGDYVLDHNSSPTDPKPWVCNDYNIGPYKYNISPDANLFSIVPSYDMGAVSFGMLAPDGTGVGYLAYAGETAGFKLGSAFIDSGTPFDGIYTDNNSIGGTEVVVYTTNETRGTWFIGHDSIKGVLTSNPVSVEEAAPAAFAVAQNSPNPFNPTTTINFTIPEASNVTVDIFNVAGQKIDTVASDFMSAGSHSVTWNASTYSAGVYFYTVKSGSFSKTMKMTLLK